MTGRSGRVESLKISLRLEHPSLEPGFFTRRFGRQPDFSARAGAPRRTPAGNPLVGVERVTAWSAVLREGTCPPETLSSLLTSVVEELGRHAELFRELASDGGKAELFVGWFMNSRNTGEEIAPALLKALSDLKLTLDVYAPE